MTSVSTATISKTGFTSVEIEITKIDHNVDNELIILTIPNKNQSDLKTWLIDLQRAKEAVTIQGILTDSSTTSAQTKKANLLKMIRRGDLGRGAVNLVWGDSPYTESNGNKIIGNILKYMITETAGRVRDESAPGTDTRGFSIQLTFVRGTHKG